MRRGASEAVQLEAPDAPRVDRQRNSDPSRLARDVEMMTGFGIGAAG